MENNNRFTVTLGKSNISGRFNESFSIQRIGNDLEIFIDNEENPSTVIPAGWVDEIKIESDA